MKKYAIKTEQFKSSSNPRKKYTTTVWNDGSLSCDCPGWILHSKRSCKHTKSLEIQMRQQKKQPGTPMIEKQFKDFKGWLVEAEIESNNVTVDKVRGRMISYLSPAWSGLRFGIALTAEELDLNSFALEKTKTLKTKEKIWALWASTPEEAKELYENVVEKDLKPTSVGGKASYIDNKKITLLKEKK